MAPSIARQAWLFCCNTVCSERVLSPVLVLLVHGLLVADVTYHRQELWQEISPWYRSVRLLVVATIALYIGTSCTNPGFVESSESQSGTSSCTCCCFLLCCGLCMRKGGSMGKVSHLSTDSMGGEPSTNLASDEPLDSESGVQMTVIDEGIQKRRGTMEIDADEQGQVHLPSSKIVFDGFWLLAPLWIMSAWIVGSTAPYESFWVTNYRIGWDATWHTVFPCCKPCSHFMDHDPNTVIPLQFRHRASMVQALSTTAALALEALPRLWQMCSNSWSSLPLGWQLRRQAFSV